jgi:Leucine-rich repeat (LRR) protein
LQILSLAGTQVSDLKPLAGLTALQSLSLIATQVSDLAPLAKLPKLQGVVVTHGKKATLAATLPPNRQRIVQ